jgi:ferric-dicitrate binding protein FerR (iron transport regulator)
VKQEPTPRENCIYAHKCGKCNRLLAMEKRQEERDAEKAARKRERRKKNGGNWAIYTAIVIAFIMAVGVVTKANETTTANSTTQQGETK